MDSSVPEWAVFLGRERLDFFLEKVEQDLANRNIRFELQAENGFWKNVETGQSFGLVNLGQTCNMAPLDDWPTLIEEFNTRVLNSESGGDIVPKDIETLRPMLRVRIYPDDALEVPVVKRPLANGLIVCLVVDLPDRTLTLDRDLARTLGVSSEDLFAIGLANVLTTAQADRREFAVGANARLISLAGDDFFTASLILAMEQTIGKDPALGSFVAVPNRHEVLVAPIDGADSLQTLGPLVQVAQGLFQAGPGSISPYIYWVRKGGWLRLELESSDEGIGILGPDVFLDEVVNPLLG